MKLELKHYLPYMNADLKLFSEKYGIYHLIGFKNDSLLTSKYKNPFNDDIYHTSFESMIPILKPMSDLTKEDFNEIKDMVFRDVMTNSGDSYLSQELMYNEYDHWHILIEDSFYTTDSYNKRIEHLSYKNTVRVHEWLVNRLFDVYGLIEHGMAKDKNTI